MAKSGINKYVVPILLIGGFGLVAYFLITRSTGGKEALGTLGGWFKNATDAINSTGEAIGSGSKRLQDAPAGIFDRLNNWFDADRAKDFRDSQPLRDAIDSTFDFGTDIQRRIGILPSTPTPPRDLISTELFRAQRLFNAKAPPRKTNNNNTNCRPVRTGGTVKMVCD